MGSGGGWSFSSRGFLDPGNHPTVGSALMWTEQQVVSAALSGGHDSDSVVKLLLQIVD